MQETIITFSPRIFLPWRKSSESFLGVLEKSIWTRRSPYSSLNPSSPTRTTLARERRRRPRSPVEANRLWRMVSVLFPSRSLVMIIPRTRGKMFWSDIARGEQGKHFIFADRSGKKARENFLAGKLDREIGRCLRSSGQMIILLGHCYFFSSSFSSK